MVYRWSPWQRAGLQAYATKPNTHLVAKTSEHTIGSGSRAGKRLSGTRSTHCRPGSGGKETRKNKPINKANHFNKKNLSKAKTLGAATNRAVAK